MQLRLLLAATAVAAAHVVPTSPSRWHLDRRAAILKKHPEIAKLASPEPSTLPILLATNGLQVMSCIACADLPTPLLIPSAIFVGGTLSLWQFALLHDVKHGTAKLPSGISANSVLFAGSLPSLFGYYLYLRYGHLSHHKNFGLRPIKDLFDSEDTTFEDGDALFVAHRQSMVGDAPNKGVDFFGQDNVGGLGISISRTIYSLFWLDSKVVPAEFTSTWNALVFSFSMTFERAALVVGGGLAVALTGRNYFFPYKPQSFHDTAAAYARVSLALQLGLLAFAGPGALLYLFLAEVGWQLPVHPASAMFVSNHPSLEMPNGSDDSGVNGCQPTASVYLGGWYDWLCCFSNYHIEHHDFPDVPAFRLGQLHEAAHEFYNDDAVKGGRDGWVQTMKRTFVQRDFYACSRVLDM